MQGFQDGNHKLEEFFRINQSINYYRALFPILIHISTNMRREYTLYMVMERIKKTCAWKQGKDYLSS